MERRQNTCRRQFIVQTYDPNTTEERDASSVIRINGTDTVNRLKRLTISQLSDTDCYSEDSNRNNVREKEMKLCEEARLQRSDATVAHSLAYGFR